MRRSVLPAILALAFPPACYLSHGDLDDGGDADARPEADVEAGDTGPSTWVFVDRDIPDRSIPVALYFAAVPAVAWNGRVAGVVYHGREPGADERIAFIPLDAHGVPVGPERQIRSGRGLGSSIPQIAADGDDFVVAFLQEAGLDTLVVLRVSAAGEVIDSAELGVLPGARDPTVAPVILDEYVYVPFRHARAEVAPSVMRLRRGTTFGTPEGFEFPVGSPYDGRPYAVSRYPRDEIIELAYVAADGLLYRESFDADIERMSLPPGGRTLEAPPQDLVSAAGDDPYLFALTQAGSSDPASLTLLQADHGPHTDDVEARLTGSFVAAASDRLPAWAATFAIVESDRWRVLVSAGAAPAGDTVVRDLIRVDDGVSPRRIEDMPRSGIAWTGDGFLVVWDEWRESAAAYGLYASHVALVEAR